MEVKEIQGRITGKVQRVMFRDFIQRKARGMRLVGEVENMQDGSVRFVAQGKEEDLERLIEHLHKGPFLARVMNVDVQWYDEPTRDFSGFKIVYD